MDTHATRQVAKKLVTLCLFSCDADAERGIGKALLHNADEFDNVLRHK